LLCILTGTAVMFAACPRDGHGLPWHPKYVEPQNSLAGQRWQVVVGYQLPSGKGLMYFGTYIDRAQAARVADRAALAVHREHAALNLPDQVTAEERRALSAIRDVAVYAEACRSTTPCAKPPKSCHYVGVHVIPSGKFRAKIRVNGITCNLGNFDASEDAAAAWDEAAVVADIYAPKLLGGARELNFPAACQVRSLMITKVELCGSRAVDALISSCIVLWINVAGDAAGPSVHNASASSRFSHTLSPIRLACRP
jgi:hypothetical protein